MGDWFWIQFVSNLIVINVWHLIIVVGALKKDKLIGIINDLGIEDLKINDLNLLSGSYVNLEYELENAIKVKFLNDNDIYLGQQIERKNNDRCYGVVANLSHLLVCEYGCNGIEPELLIYKKINI